MTLEELSNEFDVQINSYAQQEAFGQQINPLNFDEYEKSVHLTRAQEETVRELYTGASGFESTEQIRRYLSNLIESVTINAQDYKADKRISDSSVVVDLPEDLMYITYESATINGDDSCLNNKSVQVIPVTQDEYHRIKENPFRRPNSRKVLRLDLGGQKVELVSKYDVTKYFVRYLRRPYPIILTDLTDGLSINDKTKSKQCELSPELHRIIVQLAVTNAIQSRGQGSKNA